VKRPVTAAQLRGLTQHAVVHLLVVGKQEVQQEYLHFRIQLDQVTRRGHGVLNHAHGTLFDQFLELQRPIRDWELDGESI